VDCGKGCQTLENTGVCGCGKYVEKKDGFPQEISGKEK